MIRYSLQCDKGHAFEGWFRSSDDFDRQRKRGLVSCALCDSTKVNKSLMAPSVSASTRRKGGRAAAAVPATSSPQQAAPASAEQKEALSRLRQLRDEIVGKSEYVGPRFAEEARKIHFEDAPARGIYGEASADEVKSLHEDGVECYPLPTFPEDKN